jgi:aryl-alcohol dehydrogenase-like predicted oxidoreductase
VKFINIGSSKRRVSQIGLGTMQFGSKGWGYGQYFNKKDAIAIIHKAFDVGINLIDTAEIYAWGKSERIIGEAIQDYDREEFIISTKFLPKAIRPSAVVRALKKSLKRLQTDYIDIYLIHFPNPLLPLGRTLNHLEKMAEEGLIRYIGVSNYSKKRLQAAQKKMRTYRIQVNQVNYSLVKSGAEKELIPYAQNEDILIMAYSPLAQGWLSGKYSIEKPIPKGTRRMNRIFTTKNLKRGESLLSTLKEISENHDVTMAQVALNWVTRSPTVTAIPGAKSISQVESNAKSVDFELTKNEVVQIEKAIKEFKPKPFL